MIKLHPLPETKFQCPHDNQQLIVTDWYIPGMRNLADLRCPFCGQEYYGDLPSGQALYTPLLLEKKTGIVYDSFNIPWFSEWLKKSYEKKVMRPIGFLEETFHPIYRPLLLNCLDTLYGHSLLKLLNAQYYLDKCPDFDLIVLVPKSLRWMVPEDVAAIWTVDLPLKQGIEWNDWLAREIKGRLSQFPECWLSVAYSHPHPKDFDIERFTRVNPFSDNRWYDIPKRPVVTFIWREDRLWIGESFFPLINKLRRIFLLNNLIQRRKIISLANHLRKKLPNLHFNIIGIGRSGSFPTWINDLRTENIDEDIEKTWCEQYAASHVVIGVHGSNMLLPSAHAGATIELVSHDRWGNIIQDLIMKDIDCREALYRYRILPISVSPKILSDITYSLIIYYKFMVLQMNKNNLSHNKVIA